jgi:hypothetical protein
LLPFDGTRAAPEAFDGSEEAERATLLFQYLARRRRASRYRGTELDTPDLARVDAVRMLSDMAREEFPQDGDHQQIGVDVYDSIGNCVARAAISFDLDRMDSPDRTVAAAADGDE